MTQATRAEARTPRSTSDHWFTSPAALWTVQGLLTAVFLFTGGLKLFAPSETLTEDSPFPAEHRPAHDGARVSGGEEQHGRPSSVRSR
jgi:hypothetical protein